jgi:hypothetical protein
MPAAIEVQHTGVWLLPHFGGGLRFSKPAGLADAASTNARTATIFLVSILNWCWIVEALGGPELRFGFVGWLVSKGMYEKLLIEDGEAEMVLKLWGS